MKKLVFGFLIVSQLFTITSAMAETECTKEPAAKWKDKAVFQKELETTYKIKVFKVTKGNCYEIYGWNKEKKKVEIYFNPVTGEIVKQKLE